MKTGKLVHSIVIAVLVVNIPGLTFACSCIGQSPEENFEQADYVFTAFVISTEVEGGSRTEPSEGKTPGWSSMQTVNIFFDPVENFKGDSADLAHLTTAISSMSCGVPMWPGQTWIFFVRKSGFVGLCGGSHKYYPSSTNSRSLRILRDTQWLKEASKPESNVTDDGTNPDSQQ